MRTLGLVLISQLLIACVGITIGGDDPDEGQRQTSSSQASHIGLYAVDGSAAVASGKAAIWRIYDAYQGRARYWDGPDTLGWKTETMTEEVRRAACDDYQHQRIDAAALVGWSRGAIIAINAARRLGSCRRAQVPLPIRYIGALDAVDTLSWNLTKTPPAGVPTFHRVKAKRWEGVFTTVDLPGAIVSSAPAESSPGHALTHAAIGYHHPSRKWLVERAISVGLSGFVAPKRRVGACWRSDYGYGYCYDVARVRLRQEQGSCREPMTSADYQQGGYTFNKCQERDGSGRCLRATVCLPFESLEICQLQAPYVAKPTQLCF